MLSFFLALGVCFGALAAVCAYVISYGEYRRRRLRPDQSARQMALQTAVATFAVFFVAAIVLAFVLPSVVHRAGIQ